VRQGQAAENAVVVKIVAVFFIHSVSLWPAHFIPQRWG
jgi:hypothetical protein